MQNFRKTQIILSIILLSICILINTVNLLRIARQSYRLKHDLNETRHVNPAINEVRPLMDDDDEEEEPTDTQSIPLGYYLI